MLRERFPRHVSTPGDPFRTALFGWSRLNDVLNFQRLEHPRVRVSRQTTTRITEDVTRQRITTSGQRESRIDTAELYRQLNGGGTLVLDSVHEADARLAGLATALQQTLHADTTINAYLSHVPQRGFGLHWDDHEVFVVQTAGRKLWRVWAPTHPWPTHRDKGAIEPPAAGVDPELEVELVAGDFLHVPRGWWHDVIPLGEPSLHLSVAVHLQTGLDLLERWVRSLGASELLRRDLPPDPAEHAGYLDELREVVLTSLADERLVSRFHADHAAMTPLPPAAAFPLGLGAAVVPAEAIVRSRCFGSATFSIDGDEVEVRVDGHELRAPAAAAPLLRQLLTSDWNGTVSQLTGDVDGAIGLVEYLLRLGLVEVSLPSPS